MAGRLSNPNPTPFQNLADIDPGKLALRISVEARFVNPALMRQLVPTVTTLREWSKLPGMCADRVEEPLDMHDPSAGVLGDNFVYSHYEPGASLDAFCFVQVRSEDEINTPIPGKSYTTTDALGWNAVFSDLYFEESRVQFDEFIINGQRKLVPRVNAKADIIPAGSFPTKFLVEFFASHKPFPDSFFKLDVPVPGLLQWQVRNSEGDATCLHPHMIFADNVTSGNILPNCGAVGKSHQSGQPSEFPATNHTGDKNYVQHEDVQQVNGVYFCERRTAYVPAGRKKLKGVGV